MLLLALAAVSKGADASIGCLYGSLELGSVAVVSTIMIVRPSGSIQS